MGEFLRALEELLPDRLHGILVWDFLPFSRIRDCHGDQSRPHLTALFESYQLIGEHLDLDSLVSLPIPVESWGCMRCGFCCTSMRPGTVRASLYRKWERAQAPVALFFNPSGPGKRNTVYRCWYHAGVRLRMCPFMLINRCDGKPFCSIYHMGDDHRPPECSGYVPRHETCTAQELVPEPWESN